MNRSLFLLSFVTSFITAHEQTSYSSPLAARYASKEMSYCFSSYNRAFTWRTLWIALAQSEQEVGITITNEQINELMEHAECIDFEKIRQYEVLLKHDVMAHIRAYGDLCPQAQGIIHLGATSCTITDNADLIIMRSALALIEKKVQILMAELAHKAWEYRNEPCLGFTHGQVAQPTTVGKRIAGWLQDFYIDYQKMVHQIEHIYFLGIKGATGTQASFLQLLNGDHEKVKQLETLVAQKFDFKYILPISGQTYTRKQDVDILNLLADIAISAHKMANDIRLLAHMKECAEPFDTHQVGSSAMPYKRNPMKCERVCSLARFVFSLAENPKYTAAIQWFERTLDDSANRRLSIPESFLAIDAILAILISVTKDFVVHTHTIQKHLKQEFPFLAIEFLLMRCVQKGADRQEMHEYLREHSMKAHEQYELTDHNPLFEYIQQDARIPLDEDDFAQITPELFIGRAPQQVEEFITQCIKPLCLDSIMDDIEKPLI